MKTKPTTTPTGYLLDAIHALYFNPQGLSQAEMRQHVKANNIGQVIAGLRDHHGFRHCLVTETVKRTDEPNFGRYILTSEGMEKARMILEALAQKEIAA